MTILQKLYKQAYSHNHNKCGIIDKKFGVREWVDLVFGEAKLFCLRHKFPSLETWVQLDKEFAVAKYGIFVNGGRQTINPTETERDRILLIGDTDAEIICDKLTAYHIILMHGAKATIKATNRAVVFVENDGAGTVIEELTNGAFIQKQ